MTEIPFDPRMVPPGYPGVSWSTAGAPAAQYPPPHTAYPPAAGDPATPNPATPNPATSHPYEQPTFDPPLRDGPAAPVTDLPPADPLDAPRHGAVVGGADELGAILPTGRVVTFTSGMRVRVKPLGTAELINLVGIAIAGIGTSLGEVMEDFSLNPDGPTNAFFGKFVGLLIAGAFNEGGDKRVVKFLRGVCEPADKVTGGRIDKAVRDRNAALDRQLDEAIGTSPDIDDTLTIVEAIAEDNAADMQTWGKRLAGIWKLLSRAGRIPASPTSRA